MFVMIARKWMGCSSTNNIIVPSAMVLFCSRMYYLNVDDAAAAAFSPFWAKVSG